MPDGTKVRAMDEAMMQETLDWYSRTVASCRKIGFDAILLHFGHGWLPDQFLSPFYNHRSDEYGGSIENRAGFPLRILEAVRNAVGPHYPVEMRISAYEWVEGSIEFPDVLAFSRMAERYVDMIQVSSGIDKNTVANVHCITTNLEPEMTNLSWARQVKRAVSIPVSVVGAFMTPQVAEDALARNDVDAVAFGRTLIADPDSLTYMTFYAIFYALIYFFPILLAFTAGKHFKCNPYVAATLGAAIMYPGVSDLLVTGASVNLLGINFTAFNFGGSFIPILLAVFCMSLFERWLKRVAPSSVQFVIVPALCLFVFVPLTIMVFGPLGGLAANGISALYIVLANNLIVMDVVLGALFSIIILLGLHWAVTPIMLAVLASQGFEYGLAAGGMGNYAALGICLAVMLFAKDPQDKTAAGSAAFTNALCGITEPGLYGVILRDKRLIATMVVSGACGGLVLGLGQVAATNFAFSGILSFGAWLGAKNFPMYCLGIAISLVASFASTAILLKSGGIRDFG